MARCGHIARNTAETELRWRSRTKGGGIGTGIRIRQRPVISSKSSLSASNVQTLTHNPHSTEIRPRFPPRQICRRWMASIQQPQTSDKAAIAHCG
jgi:hypothetical protein